MLDQTAVEPDRRTMPTREQVEEAARVEASEGYTREWLERLAVKYRANGSTPADLEAARMRWCYAVFSDWWLYNAPPARAPACLRDAFITVLRGAL